MFRQDYEQRATGATKIHSSANLELRTWTTAAYVLNKLGKFHIEANYKQWLRNMKQAAHTARVKAMEEGASPKAADGAAGEYGALAAEKAEPAAATEEPAAAAAAAAAEEPAAATDEPAAAATLEEPATTAEGPEAEEAERTMSALKKELKESVSKRAANLVSQ